MNALAFREEGFHVDTRDLYAARPRAEFGKLASVEMGVKEEVVKRDLGRVLLKLEQIPEERRGKALEPKQAAVSISDLAGEEALGLLLDPRLMDRIEEDFAGCGVVGEETNQSDSSEEKFPEDLAALLTADAVGTRPVRILFQDEARFWTNDGNSATLAAGAVSSDGLQRLRTAVDLYLWSGQSLAG